jgi:hypothetical protein
MAIYDNIYSGRGGDLDVFIPLVWGDKVNDFAKEGQQLTPFFTDRSDELAEGGDLIYTPNLTEMTAHSKTNGSYITLNSPTETASSLQVRTWYEVSFLIEDKEVASVKKSYYLQERLTKNAVYTAQQCLEAAIAGLFSSFSNSVGSSTSVIQDSDIRKAIGILESNTKEQADNGNSAFFFDTKVWWNQINGITIFQLAINTNGANNPVTKRPMPTLYGVPVVLSNLITYVSGTTGRNNALVHKDAIHYATLKLPGQGNKMVRFTANYDHMYKGTVVTADILYGVAINRNAFGVRILSSAS